LRGSVKINMDVYAGFDTEYDQVDEMFNELVSVQLKVSNRIKVSVPNLVKEFKFQNYNIGTNDYYTLRQRDEDSELLEGEFIKVN
jgi:hypothetical protein